MTDDRDGAKPTRPLRGRNGKEREMTRRVSMLVAPATSERGEVNTASILAWTMLAVVAILAINVVFDDLVTSVFEEVKTMILGA